MSTSTLPPGFRLGKYEVMAHIANGGMGTVYKAADTELRRIVALKVLPPHLAKREPDLERFRREGRLAARLSHKHIVTLFECAYDSGNDLHYLVMEFIDGVDLGEHIERKGRLHPEDARRILIQAAKALNHAFSRGVIHRDIKPSNFLLSQVGNKVVVKLTDLGLALVQGDDDFKVTRSGTTVGTVDYMAPEQARDSRATDIRSDLYSLGCMGYHMLAGKPPFSEGGLGERIYKHMNELPPDVREFSPTVSANFWAILDKMLAKDPDERFANPAALLVELSRTPATVSAEEPVAPATGQAGRRKTDLAPGSLSSPDLSGPVGEDSKPASQRDTKLQSRNPTPASGTVGPQLVTPDQARAAEAFHQRALVVMAEGRGGEYVRELLASCLKLDPFNLTYLKTLREVKRKAARGVWSRFFGSLNILAVRSKMRLARTSGDVRKVLEHGEEILARQPADVEAPLEMAAAVAELGLDQLAVWLLEQCYEHTHDNALLLRALAKQYERVKDLKHAVRLWEKIYKKDPDDREARLKINELSVKDMMARSRKSSSEQRPSESGGRGTG